MEKRQISLGKFRYCNMCHVLNVEDTISNLDGHSKILHIVILYLSASQVWNRWCQSHRLTESGTNSLCTGENLHEKLARVMQSSSLQNKKIIDKLKHTLSSLAVDICGAIFSLNFLKVTAAENCFKWIRNFTNFTNMAKFSGIKKTNIK